MQRRGFGAAVGNGDTDQDVVRVGLGILGAHIEVATFIKDAGVAQLEFGLVLVPAAVLFDESGIRELGLVWR